MKYRKKPVIIEAYQITEDSIYNINELLKNDIVNIGKIIETSEGDIDVMIHTLEGTMIAHKGDYIIKGVKGELYPCRKDIFEETYEVVK